MEFQAHMTMTNVSLIQNEALGQGGAVYCSNSDLILNNTILNDNSPSENMGVYCASVPAYTWCKVTVMGEAHWEEICSEPSYEDSGMDPNLVLGLTIAGIIAAALTCGCLTGLGMARLFGKSVSPPLLSISDSEDQSDEAGGRADGSGGDGVLPDVDDTEASTPLSAVTSSINRSVD